MTTYFAPTMYDGFCFSSCFVCLVLFVISISFYLSSYSLMDSEIFSTASPTPTLTTPTLTTQQCHSGSGYSESWYLIPELLKSTQHGSKSNNAKRGKNTGIPEQTVRQKQPRTIQNASVQRMFALRLKGIVWYRYHHHQHRHRHRHRHHLCT